MTLTAECTSGVFVIIMFFLCCQFLNLVLTFGTFLLGNKSTGCTEGLGTCLGINPVALWRLATFPAQNAEPRCTLSNPGITWDTQSEMNPAPIHSHWGWWQKGEELVNLDLPQKGWRSWPRQNLVFLHRILRGAELASVLGKWQEKDLLLLILIVNIIINFKIWTIKLICAE